jgi:hypothetical protein
MGKWPLLGFCALPITGKKRLLISDKPHNPREKLKCVLDLLREDLQKKRIAPQSSMKNLSMFAVGVNFPLHHVPMAAIFLAAFFMLGAPPSSGRAGTTVELNIHNLSSFTGLGSTDGAYVYFETNAWLYESGGNTFYDNTGSFGLATATNAAFLGWFGSGTNGTQIGLNWNQQTGGSALYMSDAINVNTLNSPITIGFAGSVRLYVSLGSQLAVTGSNTILGEVGSGSYAVGAPNPTNINDPNYNVRWDVFEITYQGGTNNNDQMNLTAINMTAIPMQLSTSGTLVSGSGPATLSGIQTAQSVANTSTANDYAALLASLQTLANSNTANNASGWGSLPENWFVEGSNTGGTVQSGTNFLRVIGPNAGANIGTQTSTTSGTVFMSPLMDGSEMALGAQAVIGPSPSFAPYIEFVHANSVTTLITDTINGRAYAGHLSSTSWVDTTYTASWTSGGTSFTGTMFYQEGPALVSTSTIWASTSATGQGDYRLTVIIPEAGPVVAGTNTFDNNLQSKLIYDGNFNAYGPIFVWDTWDENTEEWTNEFTTLDFNVVNGLLGGDMNAIQNQVSHDIMSGFTYGFIGSTFAPDGYSGTTINDMGSPGWRQLAQGGTFTELFHELWTSGSTFFHQWAQAVYDKSSSIYGFAYSDFFQPVLLNNTQVAHGDGTYGITSIDLTIMGDVVPEPGVASLLLLGGGLAYLLRRNLRNPR